MSGFMSNVFLVMLEASYFFNSQSHDLVDALKEKHGREIRAIYITASSAISANKRENLLRFIKNSNLNAAVIDVKDSTGRIFFKTHVPLAEEIGSEKLKNASDFADFVEKLKKNKIYTIARVVVFEDPYLAQQKTKIAIKRKNGELWKDRKGLSWVDPASPLVWKYNMDIAKSAMFLGFDEINFDYIRFPTDGNLEDISYPVFRENQEKKTEVIAQFFYFVNETFKKYPVYISVDLFGITLWRNDGAQIGQRYQDAAPFVDYISPMVYPSHYPNGFEGFDNPAEYPYEIVYKSLEKAKKYMAGKKARIRPWLQDFDLGAVYDTKKIHAQIQATRQGGGVGYMFWNASNNYTQEAFSRSMVNP